MKFSELLQTLQADGDSADSDSADSMQWRAEVPESWAQGRTLFGGIQAAIGVAAMRKAVPADWPLRSLQVSFIAPVAPGAQRIQTRVLRTGKSAIHVEARLMDGDASGCFMLGIFGRGRDSAIRIAPPAPSQVVPVSASRALPFVAGVTPAFTRHLDFFWARGGFPFTGERDAGACAAARRGAGGRAADHRAGRFDPEPGPVAAGAAGGSQLAELDAGTARRRL